MGNGTEGTDEAPLKRGAVDVAEINRRFHCRPAEDMANKQQKAEIVTALAAAANVVVLMTPPGRAQAEALTHLESALLWAKHAIDRHETHKA